MAEDVRNNAFRLLGYSPIYRVSKPRTPGEDGRYTNRGIQDIQEHKKIILLSFF